MAKRSRKDMPENFPHGYKQPKAIIEQTKNQKASPKTKSKRKTIHQDHVQSTTKKTGGQSNLFPVTQEKDVKNVRFAHFAAIITVLILINIVLEALEWRNQRHAAFEVKEQGTCVDCSNLKSIEGLTVVRHPLPVSQQCCGPTGKVIQEMVAKFTAQKFEEENKKRNNFPSFPGCNKDLPSTPAVRVSGVSRIVQKDSEDDAFLLWKTVSFEQEGLKYNDGFFNVTSAGFYYVLLQISHDVTSGNAGLNFRVRVHKVSILSPEPEIVLESHKTACDSVSEITPITATTGSILKLEENDRIFVTSSLPEYLHGSEVSSFLSIHKMQ